MSTDATQTPPERAFAIALNVMAGSDDMASDPLPFLADAIRAVETLGDPTIAGHVEDLRETLQRIRHIREAQRLNEAIGQRLVAILPDTALCKLPRGQIGRAVQQALGEARNDIEAVF